MNIWYLHFEVDDLSREAVAEGLQSILTDDLPVRGKINNIKLGCTNFSREMTVFEFKNVFCKEEEWQNKAGISDLSERFLLCGAAELIRVVSSNG